MRGFGDTSLIQKYSRKIRPGQILVLGFLCVILAGAVLLTLPIAAADRNSLGFLDALFTATSAVCVTGLSVVNVGVSLSLFGQIVLLVLIQIGGLGFMTITSLLFMVVGKRISLKERLLIQESYNLDSIQGVVRLVRNALTVTFVIEGAAAVVLAVRLIPEFGPAGGVYHAVFLAVSGFCNAGFDALGQANSLEKYIADPVINIVVMLLITLGGMGFSVVLDVLRKRRFSKLMLHSRIVLLMSGILFLSGALLIGLLEWNNPNTLGRPGLNVPQKVMGACFQSVTLRTAGFDTIGQGGLTPAGTLVSIILMFIGASPASTGGGIKTTTFFAVLLSVSCMIRGKQDYNIFHRRLNEQLMRRAVTIVALALGLVLADTVVISWVESLSGGTELLSDVLFEVTSAFGTVGLSTGITPTLFPVSKILSILTLLCGRLGPLTISMALSGAAPKPDALHYPEERLIIG